MVDKITGTETFLDLQTTKEMILQDQMVQIEDINPKGEKETLAEAADQEGTVEMMITESENLAGTVTLPLISQENVLSPKKIIEWITEAQDVLVIDLTA